MVDNTCREGKNQHVAIYQAYHIVEEHALSITNPFFRVGHTHNDIDEKFKKAARSLSSASTLETPDCFMKRLSSNVHPSRNCRLHVERLHALYDFKSFFARLEIAVSGLTPHHLEPHVNHSWRFIRRADLADYWQDGLMVPEVSLH